MDGIQALAPQMGAQAPAGVQAPMGAPAPQTGVDDPVRILAQLLQAIGPQEKAMLKEMQDELLQMDDEELAALSDVFDYLEANPDKYGETVQMLVSEGVIDADTFPEQYELSFIKLMNAMVKSVMKTGEAQFANGGAVAAMGRGGDSMLAHITPGEAHLLRSRGGIGSINPNTGYREFFLGGLGKKIKNTFKKVGGFLKKWAAPVLSIGLNIAFPGLGLIASGFIGSALGTAINGGSLADSLKAGLIGGAAGAVFGGVSNMLQGGTFMQGVASELPTGLPGSLGAARQTAVTSIADAAKARAAEVPVVQSQALAQNANAALPAGAGASGPGASFAQSLSNPLGAQMSAAPTSSLTAGQQFASSLGSPLAAPAAPAVQPPVAAAPSAPQSGGLKGLLQKGKDAYSKYLSPNRPSLQTAAQEAGKKAVAEAAAAGVPESALGEIYLNAASKASGSLLQKYGPLAAVGIGGAYLMGGFEEEKIPESDPWAGFNANFEPMYPGGFAPVQRVNVGGPNYTQPMTFAAYGGAINGPGSERSDSIPARLSDGEFVFTAKAVRGAGGGNREEGIRAMYNMMNKFERMA